MATALAGTGHLIAPLEKAAVLNATIEDHTSPKNAELTVGILLKDGKYIYVLIILNLCLTIVLVL